MRNTSSYLFVETLSCPANLLIHENNSSMKETAHSMYVDITDMDLFVGSTGMFDTLFSFLPKTPATTDVPFVILQYLLNDLWKNGSYKVASI